MTSALCAHEEAPLLAVVKKSKTLAPYKKETSVRNFTSQICCTSARLSMTFKGEMPLDSGTQNEMHI